MNKQPFVSVIIVAAGTASRMNGIDKIIYPLKGTPVIIRTLRPFLALPFVREIVIVTRKELHQTIGDAAKELESTVPIRFTEGGSCRQESVFRGIEMTSPQAEYFMIHDGARPLITPDCLTGILEAAIAHQAAAPGVPVKDTIKRCDEAGMIVETPPRAALRAIQTPQTFSAALYRRAMDTARATGKDYTDDCQLVEAMGVPVFVAPGEYTNIKITTPEDLLLAEALIKEENAMIRIGHGYDVHRLVEERKLILGGVEIPWEKGLLGHSDADVLAHAISDALLGAAALGDIGKHFPDNDPAFSGADSILLLKEVCAILRREGYRPGNVDATVIAQAPKLASHIPAMRQILANAMGLSLKDVSVKATTEEKLGFTGQGEGISAHAVCTIVGI
ncbi:MAG: 2-C-methyl-D-erythritol 2,4-cyclodiphosphate synthase [Oscillospiraceae bacterium]|nr:2-C-methyl-D-erythritol 2,4-cyclodiphosphate synthase [Oscillospiraceae bacterium]